MHISPIDRSRRHFLAGGACACGAVLTGCVSTNKATGDSSFTGFYSVEDDIAMGKKQHPILLKQFGGEYDNARVQSYVTSIGNKAAEFAEYRFPYKFTVVNSPIVNAFALPGGYVYVSRGLMALASNEAELAGVISHEIGHVTARHTAERLSQSQLAQLGVGLVGILTGSSAAANLAGQGAGVFIQQFSQSQELEADTLGIRYMSKAGYSPDAMTDFLSSLRDHSRLEAERAGQDPNTVDDYNMLATHPRTIERVQQAERLAAVSRPPNPYTGRDAYLDRINGMLYGDDPSQGFIDGRDFIHPELRFRFTVPEGFVLRNSASKVTANHPGGGVIVFDMGKTARGVSMTEYLQYDWTRDTRVDGVESISVNGREAATGTTVGSSGNTKLDLRLVAIRGDNNQVYRFIFATVPNKTREFQTGLRRTTYSFERISKEAAAQIKPRRLIIVPIYGGDTIASLSRTMPFGKYNELAFRVLNDLGPNDPLPKDGVVKVVAV
ncbi:MAG: M48 family metalloprotease [Alphaproteobacteria bacterium]